MKHTQITTELLKRPIAYHAILAKAFGSVNLALMWSQLYYWSDKTKDPDGWIYKTQAEMFEETGLSRKQQDTARELGRKLEVIEDKLSGNPPKIHYRVSIEKAIEAVEKYIEKENKTPALFPEPKTATPGQLAKDFFDIGNGSSVRRDIAKEISEKTGANEEAIIAELKKFILYWTEPNKSGTKVRWEMQKNFEIKRRIYTWLNRAKVGSDNKRRAGAGVTV